MSSQSAYPLQWPSGWPRTQSWARGRSRFGRSYSQPPSVAVGREALAEELDRLKAGATVLSTNVELRIDGQPRSDRLPPSDPGVAVYFTLKEKRTVLACDKWGTVGENIYAIAKHIEALRGQQRWGVGSVEQAFAGYTALNHRTGPSCWETLGIPPESNEQQIMDAWKRAAQLRHPDKVGGTHEAMTALNEAKDIALATARARSLSTNP